MKLDKRQLDFLRVHEVKLGNIFTARIEDLKNMLLEVKEEERNEVISAVNENKFWLVMLKDSNINETKEKFTGI